MERSNDVSLTERRIDNQRLGATRARSPKDIVTRLVAVQAQDYFGSLWAVGLRLRASSERVVEQAIADRSIVRTWPMRGTLHMVAAEDVRWLVELAAPRIIAANAARLERQYGVNERVVGQCGEIVVRALEGGEPMTRGALYETLERGGIATGEQRGLHILGWLAMRGLVCVGPRNGKQPTFVLLDAWIPAVPRMERDAALAELARRYFTGHGPATLKDFLWWSGLPPADARAALELARGSLVSEVIGGETYWHGAERRSRGVAERAFLLPSYDEYTVAYKDRSAVLAPEHAGRADAGHAIFHPAIIIDGRMAGTWKRTLKKDAVEITTSLFRRLDRDEQAALAQAAERYGEFLGVEVRMK